MSVSLSDQKNEISFGQALVKKQNVDQQTGNYFNENFEFDEKIFNECVNIEIKSLTDDMLVFDVQGIDFAFANALRRLMTSDVETIAPEKIHLFQNTSVVQDEILAHRIGLIPLKADPKHLQSVDEANPNDFDSGNSIELELKVKCTQKADGTIENRNVYAKHLKWIPKDGQVEKFGKDVTPTESEILIAKLNPGQEIDAKIICTKNNGRSHAKNSPVSPASYRLMPFLRLKNEFKGEEAFTLQKLFAPGVIGVRTNSEGENVAFVEDMRKETGSRNYMTVEGFAERIECGRISDHFIFTVESTGSLLAINIFRRAIEILIEKCQKNAKKNSV